MNAQAKAGSSPSAQNDKVMRGKLTVAKGRCTSGGWERRSVVSELEQILVGDGYAAAPSQILEGLSEELVLVISAAIAAFLGKRPHIRQIRLLGSAAWAQQGRTTIQASHALPVKHG